MLLVGLVAVASSPARALATAQGVALNAPSCTNANLNLTLTTSGAATEGGRATNAAGQTLGAFGFDPNNPPTTSLANFNGTFFKFVVSDPAPTDLDNPLPAQPPGTLIGSYAYVGTMPPPPNAADTAEFFVLYNCSTSQVLLSCFGRYGTCPQTAAQAQARLALLNAIPALDPWGLAFAMLLLAGSGCVALGRRR